MRNEDGMEIDLKDIIFYWLLHYRSLIVAILLCASLFGLVGTYKEKSKPQIGNAKEVAEYSVIVSDDPDANTLNMPKKYITVEGIKGGISKSFAQSVVQGFKESEDGNIVFEVTIIEGADLDEKQVNQQEKSISKTQIIKYGVMGVAVAIFVHFMIFLIVYIVSDKIRTRFQLHNYLNIMELSSIRDAETILYKKKNALDNFLREKAGYKKCEDDSETVEEAMNVMVFKVKRLLGESKGTCNVLIAGRGSDKLKKAIYGKLSETFHNSSFVICEKSLDSAYGIERLINSDYIILAEQYGKTRFNALKEDIDLIKQEKILIAGAVWE